MSQTKSAAPAAARGEGDPFALLRRMTTELDQVFETWPSFRWPLLAEQTTAAPLSWVPRIDVFERDGRLVTRVDLPGMKKDDVSVEVTDGHLVLSGERRREIEDSKENQYRSEREYGSFYRAVPLPDGVKVEDVKASFANGVLEVSLPLPARAEPSVRKIPVETPAASAKSAA